MMSDRLGIDKDDPNEFSKIWDYYLLFERYSRMKGERLIEFVAQWKEKMITAQTAGCQYSDILLACKLLEKANLSKSDIHNIVRSIDNSRPGVLTIMLARLEAYSLEFSEGEEISFTGCDIEKQESDIKEELSERLFPTKKPLVANSKAVFGVVQQNSGPPSESDKVRCPKCDDLLDTILYNEPGESSKKGKLVCQSCEYVMHLSKIFEQKGAPTTAVQDGDMFLDSDIKEEPLDNPNSFLDITITDIIGEDDDRQMSDEDLPSPSQIKSKKKLIQSDRTHSCHVCGKEFPRPWRLTVHLHKMHGIKKKKGQAQPNDKEREDETIDDVEVEKKVKVKKVKEKTAGPCQCEFCGKKFLRISRLKDHYDKCPINGNGVGNQEGKAGRNRSPTTCKICGKTFARLYNYKIHLPLHTGERNFKCEVCPASFTHYSSLAYHKMKHRGDRPYKCDQCPKAFLASSNLSVHMRREHLMERPYQCEQCSYSTVSQSHLNRHIMSHTGERPYKCTLCDKTYRDNKSRKRHMKTHSQNDMDVLCAVPGADARFTVFPSVELKMKAESQEEFGH